MKKYSKKSKLIDNFLLLRERNFDFSEFFSSNTIIYRKE